MIWYLLWFARGTTKPPVLDPTHPIRRFFTRVGLWVAQNPVNFVSFSVLVATCLTYPIFFLYATNSELGTSNLPNHVWTAAEPYKGDQYTRPDVVMRTVWVHGSYMKALQKDVLQTALEIQDELLGPTVNFNPRRTLGGLQLDGAVLNYTIDVRDNFHAVNGLTNSSWFFHSPLLYWSCDSEKIKDDPDIITTLNQHSNQSTSVNVTLRHPMVLSAKRFEDHRLVAADALVITLFHLLDSPVGKHWEMKAAEMALRGSPKWRLYHEDGRSPGSMLYQFRFQGLSWLDWTFFCLGYACALWSFWGSMSKIRALKSRATLFIAVAAHITVSIVSSFTICAILKIDLSKIPREAYPLVAIFISLENIFRLTKAVVTTPSNRPIPQRISEALGQTGHLALASAAGYLIFLWTLSCVAPYSGIGAFCIFAACAVGFEIVYLMLFFTAVLSVDIKRTELEDSLSRASPPARLTSDLQLQKKKWTDAVLSGEAPHSTRIAGTIMMVGFVLIAYSHFNEDWVTTFSRVLHPLRSERGPQRATSPAMLSVDIHPARDPIEWLRLQDHETAKEVIQVIKPHASAYIARVYQTLAFVLEGSDRTPNDLGVRRFLPAFYDLVRHQKKTFFITVAVLVACVRLLMSYYLFDQLSDREENQHEDEPLLTYKTLSKGHTLDVMLLAASRDGVLATVGLDRWIRIWDVRNDVTGYIVRDSTAYVNPFPVLAIAIDRHSNWLALLSARDQVYLWNIPEKRWGPSMQVEIRKRKPAAFFFGKDTGELIAPVVVVRHKGLMSELHIESKVNTELQICRSPLVSVRQHFEKPDASASNPPPRIITSSKKGCVHVASQLEQGWTSDGLEIPFPDGDPEILSILPLPALSSFLAVRKHTVDLIDIFTHKVTHTFVTEPMKQGSLRCFHSPRRRPQCGSVGLATLALAYTCAEGDKCVMQSYLPRREGDTICFRDPYTPGSKTCCLWRETVENRYEMKNPGQWEALQVGYLVGIRKREPTAETMQAPARHTQIPANSGLRRRGVNERESSQSINDEREDDAWEAWSLSGRGEESSVLLFEQAEKDHLLISSPGPMVKIGNRSIAFAMGNVVKVVSVGNDKFDDESSNDDGVFVGMAAASSRRRRPNAARVKSNPLSSQT